jgi:NDP-sugar pyrophosphorylase family protein
MAHYELTQHTTSTSGAFDPRSMAFHEGTPLRRIRALIDLPHHGVRAGDLGGFVETTDNLLGNAWIHHEAQVHGDAQVFDDVWVGGNAEVSGRAKLYGHARVGGSATIFGDARVGDSAHISGKGEVGGTARVFGDARVEDSARVVDNALITGTRRFPDERWCVKTQRCRSGQP